MSQPHGISVGAVLRGRPEASGLTLELLAGEGGLDALISNPHIQKTGLALAGFHEYLKAGRVLVFGESEIHYLEGLEAQTRVQTMRRVYAHDFPCVLVTGDLALPPDLLIEADRANRPLLRTRLPTPTAITKLESILEDFLAARTTMHAVLIDVLGLGVLIAGESGIGKSECALDLIVRGHRLVADDVVEIRRRAETILIGTCPDLTRHHMELRGLGVINVREIFGIASIRSSKRVELVVRLERWDQTREYERLGLDDATCEILGLRVPLIQMPVAPGRNIAILVEVAARNQLLRAKGYQAARLLAERLDETLKRQDVGAPGVGDTEDEEFDAGETQ